MPQSHILKLCLASLCLVLCAAFADAATWTADASFSVERTTEVAADGTTHQDTFDQSYTLSYETTLLELLEFNLEFALDVDESTDDPGFTTRDTSPSVDAGLVAAWWDLSGSWEETKTTNTDPAEGRTVDSQWEFEAVVEPEFEALPSFSFDVQGGNDDVIDKDVNLVFEYSFLEMVDASLGFSRETSDVPEADSDTDGRTIEAEIGLSRDLTQAIVFEADWSMDRDQILTLTDAGEILEREDTLSNEVTGSLEWNLLEVVTLSVERDLQWDKDLEHATLEVTDTWTSDVEYDRDLTEALHLNLAYGDERENARPVGPHTYSITRDYTAELEFAPYEWLSISPSFDRSDTVQWSREVGAETDDTLDDSYELVFDYALWDEFLTLEVTRSWDFSWERGSKTTEDRSWDVALDLAPGYVPNLELTPSYGYTRDDDAIAGTTDEEETIELGIVYELAVGERLVFGVDHTYSRTQNWPADAKMTVDREDDTDLTVTWDELVRGVGSEVSMTRAASDTSGDDKGPEVDYTYSFTADWEILSAYSLSFEYNRDVKQESEDTQDFTTTFSAEFQDGRITLDLEHEFDEQLEGDPNDTHRYLIELQGEF